MTSKYLWYGPSMTHVDDPLLTPQEAADFLGVAPSTLMEWRHKRKGPTSIRVGHRTIRYRQSAIDAWLNERGDA